MNKLLSALIVSAVASFAFSAHAASHTGGAPMKAEAAEPAASGAKKAKTADKKHSDKKHSDMKKSDMKKSDMKGEMKGDMKGDMKKDAPKN